MTHDILIQLSLALVVAFSIALVMRILRQPQIVGYIITGILVGPSFLNIVTLTHEFSTLADFGVAILLFVAGLGMKLKIQKEIQNVVLSIIILNLFVISGTAFVITSVLGFSLAEAAITSLILSFSSTILVVKLLSDRHEQYRAFSKTLIGVLLVEDLLAAFILLFITSQDSTSLTFANISWLILKGSGLILILWIFGSKILPKLSSIFTKSQELLFLSALAWAMTVSAIFEWAGFSIEIGALFAGIALSHSKYLREISARLIPIRDFFLVIFFIALGIQLTKVSIESALVPAVSLALLIIIGKPLVVMTAMKRFNYTKNIRFKTGIYTGQVSELSIIIAALASSYAIISPSTLSLIILVALITIGFSSYLIKFSDNLFLKFYGFLFGKDTKIEEIKNLQKYDVVIFGLRKGGGAFIKNFKKQNRTCLVVEHDPHNIPDIEKLKVDFIYGDANDVSVLNEIDFSSTKITISTINDHPTNLALLAYIHDINPSIISICHATDSQQAVELYKNGASYVMMPHHIGSEKIASFIKKSSLKKQKFADHKKKHLNLLRNTVS